jgi:serine/threonine protein kinase
VSEDSDDKTQSVTVLTKGTVINHYRIVDKIGAGGIGEVYLAEDTELDRKVAFKFLPKHFLSDARLRGALQAQNSRRHLRFRIDEERRQT